MDDEVRKDFFRALIEVGLQKFANAIIQPFRWVARLAQATFGRLPWRLHSPIYNLHTIADLERLSAETLDLRDKWPTNEDARWRREMLDTVSAAFGKASDYYAELVALTFGGVAPLTWGQGLRGQSDAVKLFRQRRFEDYDTAHGF
jgi:hypothetical protein